MRNSPNLDSPRGRSLKDSIRIRVDEDIIDLAEGFLRHRRGAPERIREAMSTDDWTFVHRIGHELKGTAGSYGFRGLSAIGRELEDAADTRDSVAAAAAVERMLDYLERVSVLPRRP